MADFLNREAESAIILHEANVNDYWFYHKALRSEEEEKKYIGEFRKNEIYYRIHKSGVKLYGEINPFLRRHCKALQELIPNAKYFHLVRDGRDVVRSIMSREILSNKDPLGHLTYPPDNDEYKDKWQRMNRFEKICWLWQTDNRYMREQIRYTIQFEQLISDYDYFKEKLLDYIGIFIDKRTWEEYMNHRVNITPSYKIPHWSQWSKQQMKSFDEICSDEMEKCGYSLKWEN